MRLSSGKLWDIELKIAHFFSSTTPVQFADGPVEIQTSSGCINDGSGEDATDSVLQFPSIAITKTVSCNSGANAVQSSSVTALRGSTVYFTMTVTNTGTDTLNNVVVTDVYSALDTANPNPIPGTISIGTLTAGQSVTKTYAVPTSSTFSLIGTNPDITNTATVTGDAVIANSEPSDIVQVSAGPATATVNILVPSLTCNKLVASSANPTVFVSHLDLTTGPCTGNDSVIYQLTLTNNGEVPIDFTQGLCASAGGNFSDTLLTKTITGVTGTPVNLGTLFFAKIPTGVLSSGQSVSVDVPVTLQLDGAMRLGGWPGD